MEGEFLTSNTAISYPFRQDQDIPEWLRRMFVDAVVASDDRLVGAAFDAGSKMLSFTVGSTAHSTVLDGGGFKSIRSIGSCFVLDGSYAASLASDRAYEFSGGLEFEASCVETEPESVERILVYNGTDGTGSPDYVLQGDVVVACGYNADLETDEQSTLEIGAVPGAGLGTVPCDNECPEDLDTDGGHIPTDDGHAVIGTDGCYEVTSHVPSDESYVQPSQFPDAGGFLQIHGKCTACCQCQSFADIVADLRRIAVDVHAVKKNVTETATNVYYEAIEKFSMDTARINFDVSIDVAFEGESARALETPGSKVFQDDRLNFARVTCMVTNISGVPVLFTVPDLWDAGECGGFSIGAPMCIYGELYDGEKTASTYVPYHLSRNGIQAWVDTPGSTGCTLDAMSLNPGYTGGVYFSRVRGPKYNRGDNVKKVVFPAVLGQTSHGWMNRLTKDSDWRIMADMAIRDLNSGVNPSNNNDVFEGQLVGGGREGYMMPAGYSLAITHIYAIPRGLSDARGFSAMFRAYAYAPALYYSMAYNTAKSTPEKRATTDGYVYTRRWHADDRYVRKDAVLGGMYAGVSVDFSTGKYTYTHSPNIGSSR